MSPSTPPPPYPDVARLQRAPRREQPHRSLSMRLCRVSGIEIRVHATFLFLVALVALGATVPGGPAVVEQFGWVVVLFACVVLHELAHSLVARAHGVAVHEIELLPIGGLSKLESEPKSAHDELLIAGAGPVASLGVGVAVAAVGMVVGITPWPIAIYGGAFLTRVVWVNVLLAGFNLLPALPLDGGRVLRAGLTPRLGRERATHVAAKAGRYCGAALAALGLLVNLWLLIIGAFVFLGATAEEAASMAERQQLNGRAADASEGR